METNNIEKVSFVKLSQEVNKIIRTHAKEDSELENDLYALLELIDQEQVKYDKIKSLAYELAGKLG